MRNLSYLFIKREISEKVEVFLGPKNLFNNKFNQKMAAKSYPASSFSYYYYYYSFLFGWRVKNEEICSNGIWFINLIQTNANIHWNLWMKPSKLEKIMFDAWVCVSVCEKSVGKFIKRNCRVSNWIEIDYNWVKNVNFSNKQSTDGEFN